MNEKLLEQKAEQYASEKINLAESMYNPNAESIARQAYLAGAKQRERRIEELKEQIEKMKCCDNCCHCGTNYDCDYCSDHFEDMPDWQLKE